MELKLRQTMAMASMISARSNRTFMELKYWRRYLDKYNARVVLIVPLWN